MLAIWSLFSPNENLQNLDIATTTNADKFSRDFIRVCSWNVHNYNVSNRRVSGGRWISYPKPENERNAVCEILAKIDADVILLQEMGDITYLRDLHSRLSKVGKEYSTAIVSAYDAPSRLAILSRIKPSKIFDFSDTQIIVKGEKTYSPRGTLGVKLYVAGEVFYAFSIHLKSKVGAKKKDEAFIPFRFAELRAIRKRVESSVGKNAKIIYGGDFNDDPKRRFLRNLGDVELLQQYDMLGFSHTYHWEKKNIFYKYDFFVVTQSLVPFIKDKAVIVPNGIASDHRPVYVDISVNSKEKVQKN